MYIADLDKLNDWNLILFLYSFLVVAGYLNVCIGLIKRIDDLYLSVCLLSWQLL